MSDPLVPVRCRHCARMNYLAPAAGVQYCEGCGLALTGAGTQPPQAPSGGGSAQSAGGGGTLLYGRYLLEGELGRGGFGAVYKARDTRLNNRPVAIKQTLLQGGDPEEIKEAVATFTREMELLSLLSHPNLPAIYDWFTDSTNSVLVMEFIDGLTLEEHLLRRKAPLGSREAATLGKALAEVLSYLHGQQPPIIFRDLKPANVMLKPQGKGWRPYLIDFGIARLFKPGQVKDTTALGSHGYAAPEQYGKYQSNERTDLYALGATLYYALCLDDPAAHPFFFPPFDPSLQVPGDLQTLVSALTKFDQADRPANAQAVADVLEAFLTGPPGRASALLTPVGGAAGVAQALPTISDRQVRVCVLSASLVAQQDGRYERDLADGRLTQELAATLETYPWSQHGREVKVFYELHGGQVIIDTISSNIEKATCVLVFASYDLLSSRTMKHWLSLAFSQKMQRGLPILVVPLITCKWQEASAGIELCPTLPLSGRAVVDFKRHREGYQAVLTDFLQVLGLPN